MMRNEAEIGIILRKGRISKSKKEWERKGRLSGERKGRKNSAKKIRTPWRVIPANKKFQYI